MKLSKKVFPVVMFGLLSFNSFANSASVDNMGCLQKMNKEFNNSENLRNELNIDSSNKLQKMILPSYIPGAFFGVPGLTTAFFSIYITGIVDQVQIHQMIKTASVLEISDKIKNNKKINSEDYYKLGIFYKLKDKLELKAKRNISDEALATLIMSENDKAMDENIFCSTKIGGDFSLSRMNRKLFKKLYESFGVNEDEIAVDASNEDDDIIERVERVEIESKMPVKHDDEDTSLNTLEVNDEDRIDLDRGERKQRRPIFRKIKGSKVNKA